MKRTQDEEIYYANCSVNLKLKGPKTNEVNQKQLGLAQSGNFAKETIHTKGFLEIYGIIHTKTAMAYFTARYINNGELDIQSLGKLIIGLS